VFGVGFDAEEPPMPTLQTHSCAVHYRDEGAGEPAIVFLHGWCDDASIWDGIVPAFSVTHRCLVPEMRGHGRSGMPVDHGFFPEALSNDVVAICAAAGVARPVLVGHSYGGYLAAEIVRRHPGFARAVVIEDQALNIDGFGLEMRQMEAVIRSPETHMAFREQLKRMLMPEGTPPEVVEQVLATGLATPVEVGLALWAALFEYTETELRERGQALMRAIGTVPALVLERMKLPEYHGALRNVAPTAQVEVMPGSHWIHLEHRAAFIERVRALVESVG
jgi:pimeloyl-ACP methyl ester carboxylesterase